jgi:hypothetical protein
VIGIVKKKLEARGVSEQSDADEMLVGKDWEVVGSARPDERDLGGGGKGRHLSPFIPRISISRRNVR